MAKAQRPARGGRKKKVQVESNGNAYIKASFNNVLITITDAYGNTISWSSSGKMGFRGSRKNTPYAAQVAGTEAAKEAYDLGLRRVDCYVKGLAPVVRAPFAHSPSPASRSSRSATPLRFPTTAAGRPSVAASEWRGVDVCRR